MRWFRFYDDVVSDPKAQMLSDELFRAWVNVLCIASKHDGKLPALSMVAYYLRLSEAKAAGILTKLCGAGLLDKDEATFTPHNWSGRQFKSDAGDNTNAARQKRYRNAKRNGDSNVTRNVTGNGTDNVTPKRPETDTETDSSEANASGADAPVDHRKRLFSEGLSKLAKLTGKGPDACRSFVGKCLKAVGDDAVTVLGLIEDAERNQVSEASAWIVSRLKPAPNFKGNGNGTGNIIQASDDLIDTIRGFDAGPGEGQRIRRISGAPDVRLLPQG